MRGWKWGLLGALACTGSLEQLCITDADQDEVCDEVDACPGDPGNDPDGDGVCAFADVCAEGDDRLDEDEDGTPDACDACLDDAGNDPDGDGVCAKQDPCPDVLGVECERVFTVGLIGDTFAVESRYRVVDDAGTVYAEGGFLDAGEVLFQQVEVPQSAERLCIELTDDLGDGGVAGYVWAEDGGTLEHWWAFNAWESAQSYCTAVPGGAAEQVPSPIDEAGFKAARACALEIVIDTAADAHENSWALSVGARRRVTGVTVGTYADYMTYTYPLLGFEGEYVFTMTDSYGDGWQGGSFAVRYEGDVLGEPLATGVMGRSLSEDVEFTVDCPDPEGLDLSQLEDDTGY
jgi:hypothetical protein